MAKILIGTPVAGLEVATGYMMSMVGLVGHLLRERTDVGFVLRDPISTALAARARNAYATLVLEDPSLTHLLLVEPTVGFHHRAVLRLLDCGKDIVGCRPQVALAASERGAPRSAGDHAAAGAPNGRGGVESGLMRTHRIGSALTLVSRTALERLRDAFPELSAEPDAVYRAWGVRGAVLQCFDAPPAGDGLSAGEDDPLCSRWRSLGGELWALTDERLTQVVPTTFSGRFLDRLQSPTACV